MAKPTKKALSIEGALDVILGGKPGDSIRTSSIGQNKCVARPIGCNGDATEFRDAASKREYQISGLCQSCQDNMFGV